MVLNGIIRFALRNRLLIVLISLGMLVYGSYVASEMPIDVFPDLDRPRVIIITECAGLAAEEVEALVTHPIETAVLGASGVQAVRSQSTAGLNVIYVEFHWNTQIRSARQTVQERLTSLAGILPNGIHPQIAPPASIMGQILIAGIYRQSGPSGGELFPVAQTKMLAELIRGQKDETPQLKLWQPTSRRRVNQWKPIICGPIKWSHVVNPRTNQPQLQAEFTLGAQRHVMAFDTPGSRRIELRTIADWVIRPRIRKITGVAEAFVLGGDRKQYQVRIDPSALLEYGVTLQDVERALRESNINSSGGFAVTGETERPIRVLGRLGPNTKRVLSDLRRIPVRVTKKRSVLLSQVANVVEGAEFKRGDASVNGRTGVVFTVVKQPHVDTRLLTKRLEAAFYDIESTLSPDIVINPELFQLRKFIDRGVFNVAEAMVIGATLVIVILFLFLLNFRTTFITLTAIPLSLVTTVLVFRIVGMISGTHLSINVMTLGGITVALGELVDDAIVDVENIFRRLKENHTLENPRSSVVVVYDASREIRSSIVFGTAVVILVFLPLFALSGIAGRLFAPLGVAYIVSILASLLISLTVTPVLSYYLLPKSRSTHTRSDGPLLRLLKWVTAHLIRISFRHPFVLLLLTWAMVAAAAWHMSQAGKNFLPEFDEGSVQINVTLPPGASLESSNRASAIVDARLQQMQRSVQNPQGDILHFVRRTGRALLDEHANPVNMGEYILTINPDSQHRRAEIIKELLTQLRGEVPGIDIEVEQPLAHLISHMVSGVYAQIAIKVFGDDVDTLRRIAEQAKSIIQDLDGITPPVIEPIRQTDQLHIRLRPDDLAFHGVTRAYVANIVETALEGTVVSQVLEGQRRFDLLVRLEEDHRTDYANLGRLRIDLPGNRGQIQLRELADIGQGLGPNAFYRENARRRIVIRCNTQGRDLASAVNDIQSRLRDSLELPTGYFIEYGGQFESQRNATRTIMLLAWLAIVAIFSVLLILLPSLRIVLQILHALPTAFVGGVVALALTNQSISVASLVGFISLGGIAVRNGILLVTHYFHLMRAEGESFSQEMILRGSLERLAPVLMTALTAGIGLLPLVLAGQEPGREFLYPVATVILGGLVTSTFCEFLIHPGLFWHFSGRDASRILSREIANEEL